MLALDAAPHHFKTAPRVVNGPVPAGEDCLGPREGEVRALLSRGQPGAALPRFTCYTRLGVHPSFLTQLLNANDELLRSWASALQACVDSSFVVEHSGRKCGATRRRRPT